jgi:hypothetical protein
MKHNLRILNIMISRIMILSITKNYLTIQTVDMEFYLSEVP